MMQKKLTTLFSPLSVLHITQRNYIWVIEGVEGLQCVRYIAGNKRQNLDHIRILQDRVQVLHNRLNLFPVEGGEHSFQGQMRDGRGQPQRWTWTVTRTRATIIRRAIVNKRHGHIQGVDDETLRRGATVREGTVRSLVVVATSQMIRPPRSNCENKKCRLFILVNNIPPIAEINSLHT